MLKALSSLPRALRRRARSLNTGDSRGQSLVELAMTLPVILLLTLIALDFGRVYLGYINLQNMSRVAANFAANHPDAWGTTPDSENQTRYRNQILADAAAINCTLPVSGGQTVVPAPDFTDVTGDGTDNGLGDTVRVRLNCTFGVITPGIANILGGSVPVGAESSFAVKSGITSVAGGGSVPVGTPPNAAFKANESVTPSALTVVGPVVDVEFRDTSGGYPTAWAWDFSDGTTSSVQDPLAHTFDCSFASCSYLVTMRATNLAGSSLVGMTVTVIGDSDVNFTSDRQTGNAPIEVQFKDTSSPGGTAWSWSFGDGGTGTGTTPSHTYTDSGTYDVSLTVTYPGPTGDVKVTKAAFITVGEGACSVPSLNGVRINDALDVWRGYPYNFTGDVIRDPGAPSGNFLITAQSLPATALVPCSSDVTVNRP